LRGGGPRPIVLLQKPFSARRFTKARRSESYADGGFGLRARPTVDTLYAVAPVSGRARLGVVGVAVYPSAPVRLRYGRATHRINAQLQLTFDPKIRLGGHTAYIYLDRVDRHDLIRLGGGRLIGRRGHARMSTSFPPVTDVVKGDQVLWCVPRMSKLGLGYDDLVDRRCGQGRISYRG
jgi:hypothetical protein